MGRGSGKSRFPVWCSKAQSPLGFEPASASTLLSAVLCCRYGLGRGEGLLPPMSNDELAIDLSMPFLLNPAEYASVFAEDDEPIALLLETPSGFAIFTMHGYHFKDPDAMEVLDLIFPCY